MYDTGVCMFDSVFCSDNVAGIRSGPMLEDVL